MSNPRDRMKMIRIQRKRERRRLRKLRIRSAHQPRASINRATDESVATLGLLGGFMHNAIHHWRVGRRKTYHAQRKGQ